MSALMERRDLLAELASKGIRLTLQRRALIEVIQEASEHLDAASLLELARQREPNIDRATVYRTLELLKKLRLIDELDLMHLYGEKHYYEAKTERNHAHLACFRCGRIEEYSSPLFERLKAEISKQAGFTIKVTRLEVGGNCSACAADTTVREDTETRIASSAAPVTSKRVPTENFLRSAAETRASTTWKVGDPLIIRPPSPGRRKSVLEKNRNEDQDQGAPQAP